MLVDRGAFVLQVIRADDRCVAACISAADPTLFDHRDIGDTVFRGKVVSGGKAMAATSDDDHVIGRLRLGRAPLLWPILMARQGVTDEAPERVALHQGGAGGPPSSASRAFNSSPAIIDVT